MIRWASVRAMPSYDAEQDIRNTSMESENGEMMMSFVRDIYTTKQSDSTLGSQCMYILSAWGGNVLSYSTPATFSKHTEKGVISQLICLQQCTGLNYYNYYHYKSKSYILYISPILRAL